MEMRNSLLNLSTFHQLRLKGQGLDDSFNIDRSVHLISTHGIVTFICLLFTCPASEVALGSSPSTSSMSTHTPGTKATWEEDTRAVKPAKSLSQRYFACEAGSQDEMADSDECKTAKTRSNTIASGEEGVRGRIEIELDPVVAGRGGDTLYSVLCDFVAGVVSSPPSFLFPRIMFSFAKSFPRLQEASRNSSRNLRLWTRRGGSIRAIFVISVGTITLLALTGLLIFLCFLFTATLNAVIVSLLVSLVAAGGFLAFFFSCLIAIYIGTLSIAAFAISITTISTIIAIMVATGWIGFFWVIWLVAKKSLGLTSQSVSKASSIISTYSKTRQAS